MVIVYGKVEFVCFFIYDKFLVKGVELFVVVFLKL